MCLGSTGILSLLGRIPGFPGKADPLPPGLLLCLPLCLCLAMFGGLPAASLSQSWHSLLSRACTVRVCLSCDMVLRTLILVTCFEVSHAMGVTLPPVYIICDLTVRSWGVSHLSAPGSQLPEMQEPLQGVCLFAALASVKWLCYSCPPERT